MNEKVDFVILWVDGSDPEWLKEKNEYSEIKFDIDASIARYRDTNTLKYWFRAVEKYTPWVNKIHFVTWGHLPKWLNTSNKKLNIVKHKDFIPKQYLPTFSANPIELNLHRIKGLEERFVYFNDDMFIMNPLKKEFFFKNGLPCDFWKENTFQTEISGDNFFDHIVLNDLFFINKNFNKKEVLKNNFNKVYNFSYGKRNFRNLILSRRNYFCGFDITHTAHAFLKSDLCEVWEKDFEILDRTCSHKFRSVLDINQWAVHWYQMVKGDFTPVSHKRNTEYFSLQENNEQLYEYMFSPSATVVCINDTSKEIDFDKVTKELVEKFELKFPNKCSFEK